ncbi:MAG: hypothetical protein M3Q06_11000 [Bacteroidota bacterium]|nr:hypothetical protein [Bacteroidota bacterium]
MKPLIVLLVTFLFAVLGLRLVRHKYEPAFAARIAMSVMLVFTATGHFAFTRGMAMMLPGFIPFKTVIVYVTGIVEIVAAIGLLITSTRRLTAFCLIIYFILVLPANIYAAIHHIDYQNATLTGPGLNYLWFRVPLQVLFIVWTYLSSTKGKSAPAANSTFVK